MLRWSTVLSIFGCAFYFSAAAISTGASASTVPGAYIIEFADNYDSESFYGNLRQSRLTFEHRRTFDYKLFQGVSLNLRDIGDVGRTVERIASMVEVKHIWPVQVFFPPKVEVHWKGDDRAATQLAMQKRGYTTARNDNLSTHVMTQVNRLRADGVTGHGVRIAVIDTGIDYTHPALGGCFGPGCLVSYGTDLVGDDYDAAVSPVPVPDDDPVDTCNGHGTHVAGIIAARENPYGFTGAAPGVTLGAYRVFGCNPLSETSDEELIAAMNQAYEDGSDIITASLGSDSGWSSDAVAVVAERLVDAGVIFTAAVGNSGAQGLFLSGSPASGKGVSSIASFENYDAPTFLVEGTYRIGNGTEEHFGWTPAEDARAWGNVSLPLWALGYDTSDPVNGCAPFPESTPDLSGYIVLIRRGACFSSQKAANAAAFGTRFILFYNNEAGTVSLAPGPIEGIEGLGMVTAQQGEEWINLLANNTSVTLNITDPEYLEQYLTVEINTQSGGFASTFTTWGPDYGLDIKPDFGAPGGIILSTYPLALGGYAVLSGTSMSTPLVAAIYALISQVRGTKDPKDLQHVLTATSKPNVFYDGKQAYPYLAPVAQQGAGLVQAYDAAYATTILDVTNLSFNDTGHFIAVSEFTISNTGAHEVTYSIGHVSAATAYTLDAGSILPSLFTSVELVGYGAELEFSAISVTIPTGCSQLVTVYPRGPVNLDESRLPVYSGYIVLNGTNGENLTLPYLGVQGNMYSATILDANNTYLSQSNDTDLNPNLGNQTYLLPATNATATNGTIYPVVVVSLALGTARLRVDVVPQDRSINTTIVLGVPTLGNIADLLYPNGYYPRIAFPTLWNGTLDDGSSAPSGTYTIVVRALKLSGDAELASEYEMVETVPITIKYI